MKPIRITLHCSASEDNKELSIASLRIMHIKERGWNDIGYHVVIQPSGEVGYGRPMNIQGAGVRGENLNNIHICLVGNKYFPIAQFHALKEEINKIHLKYDIPTHKIFGHYEFQSAISQGKTCPNIRISDFICWYLTEETEAIAKYVYRKER